MPKKPTGTNGFTTLSNEGVAFHRRVWPTDKRGIEDKVLRYFEASLDPAERRRLDVIRVRQNDAENDLDGTVETKSGDILIDVAEIAPLAPLRGNWDAAKPWTTIGELADTVLTVVRAKSAKYVGIKPRPWLLLYATHWAFNPTDTTLKVVGAELFRSGHNLDRVYFVTPMDDERAALMPVLPVPPEAMRIDIAKTRPLRVRNFDPREWEATSDGTFIVRVT